LKRPPLSTGDVVENYELLFAYWRKARELGREDLIERTLIKEEDLKLLEEMIRESGAGGAPLNLGLLIDRLTETLSSRVDPEVAKKALEEIEKLPDDAVIYKTVGTLIVKTEKDKAVEELREKVETLEVRLNALERQEKKLNEKLKELTAQIQASLRPTAG